MSLGAGIYRRAGVVTADEPRDTWIPGDTDEINSSGAAPHQETDPAQTDKEYLARRRKVITISAVSAAAVLILILVIVLTSGSSSDSGSSGSGTSQSISYKDGYACGQGIVAGSNQACTILDGSNSDQSSADNNCDFDFSPLDNGDNVDQWTQGCLDGVNDGFYQQAHPGA